jgi:hypothetical protein
MPDDPTTKPCPTQERVIDYMGGGTKHSPTCRTCQGTGRVPLTTAELLEALLDLGYHVSNISKFHGRTRVNLGRDERPMVCTVIGNTPDDALRAALRAVTR